MLWGFDGTHGTTITDSNITVGNDVVVRKAFTALQ